MYKIGNEVKVIKAVANYNTYQDMADIMELITYKSCANITEDADAIYKIVAKSYHGRDANSLLYGIESLLTGKQYIIGADGIRLKEEDTDNILYGLDFGCNQGDVETLVNRIFDKINRS